MQRLLVWHVPTWNMVGSTEEGYVFGMSLFRQVSQVEGQIFCSTKELRHMIDSHKKRPRLVQAEGGFGVPRQALYVEHAFRILLEQPFYGRHQECVKALQRRTRWEKECVHF